MNIRSSGTLGCVKSSSYGLSTPVRYLASILILALISHATKADFSGAIQNYEVHNFAEAMSEFKNLASLGHKESQTNIGVMYFRGEGVEKDPITAYAWTALAAEGGNAELSRTRDLIMSKLAESDRPKALSKAEELLNQYGETALSKSLSPALLADEDCAFTGNRLIGYKMNYPKEALDKGIVGSVDVVGDVDKNGFFRDYSIVIATNDLFIQPVLDSVRNWRYKPLVQDGEIKSVAGITARARFTIENGELDKKKLKKYMNDLKDKATNGSAVDKYTYAYAMDIIPEIKYEKKDVNEWMFAAAQMGLSLAQYKVGKNLFYGEGCVSDTKKGLTWLTMSARSNNPQAQYFLGANLLLDNKLEQNKSLAIEWLEHSAKSNYPKATMKLAWLYATDKTPTVYNPKRALELVNAVYRDYNDKLTANETLAAAQAANGLFDDAVKNQKTALALAKKIKGMPTDSFEKHLLAYQSQQSWSE